MADSRNDNVYMAKLTEQAERYGDMVDFMKKIAESGVELTVEERNLLSVAYKNQIGAPRAAWRIINSIEQKETQKKNENNAALVAKYRGRVENELKGICKDILSLLDNHLLQHAQGSEPIVFYLKMKGDYHRYHAEFASGDEKQAASDAALKAYTEAMEKAHSGLAPTHPIRLGLALNFSVFYYEVLNNPDDACRLAKSAFDDAIAELDSINDEAMRDSTLILQLLRDNLTLWTADTEEGEEKGDDMAVEEVEDN